MHEVDPPVPKTKVKKPPFDYLTIVPDGHKPHGRLGDFQSQLFSDITTAVSGVNKRLKELIPILRGCLHNKTHTALIHDIFVQEMEELLYTPGPKNNKPDLLHYYDAKHCLMEVKGSSKRDFQSHPTKDQLPPPEDAVYILLAIDGPELVPSVSPTFVTEALVLTGVTWADGSGKNSKYVRITAEDLKRAIHVCGTPLPSKVRMPRKRVRVASSLSVGLV